MNIVKPSLILLLVLISLVWAGSFIAVRLSVDEIPPIHLGFLRFLVATPIMVLILFISKKEIDFSKHNANTPIVIPEAIKQGFSNDDEARSFLTRWKSDTLRKIYSSSEWNRRIQENFDRFPELREGINFYMAYLKDNLG